MLAACGVKELATRSWAAHSSDHSPDVAARPESALGLSDIRGYASGAALGIFDIRRGSGELES